jgi:hypothetical protein
MFQLLHTRTEPRVYVRLSCVLNVVTHEWLSDSSNKCTLSCFIVCTGFYNDVCVKPSELYGVTGEKCFILMSVILTFL